jgi:hypothetical protein
MLENPGVIQGREHGLPEFDGDSLVPLMQDEAAAWNREVSFTTRRVESLAVGGMAGLTVTGEEASTLLWVTITGKQYALLIGGKKEDSPELYDLLNDPKQKNNIYSENKEIARKMAESLFEFAAEKGIDADVIAAYRSRIS